MIEDSIIEVRGLRKSFRGQAVLDGVDISFPRGEITAILGQSGTGKSVLMKHLVGIFEPDAGEILVDGRDIVHLSYDEKRVIRRRLGYLFQDAALFDSMTVEENIAFPLIEVLRMKDRGEIGERVKKLLDWVQLPGIEKKMPDELSGGMRKRVGLARILASEPEVMLFDEPTTGLDPLLGENVHKLIERVNRELEMTCIIITHDIVGSFDLADKIAFLHQGEVLVQGTPEKVRSFRHPVLQKFLEYSFVCEDEVIGNGEE
jgi:phospholipid/cholesterol/gamma-HCH transport system ATP-binding protein